MIRHLLDGKWRLYSKDGSRNLGTFDSKAEAVRHEEQVNYFKSHKGPRDHEKGGDATKR